MAEVWDPLVYGHYRDQRARPFFELVARVAVAEPTTVVDLGCGSGELTAQLSHRWPGATVTGVDSSAEMLTEAASHRSAPQASARVRFELGDIRSWEPAGPVDVIVANAALQWIPEHPSLLERFVGWLTPGGWLAFQVPGNFRAPSHAILAELRLSDRWRAQVGEGADRHLHVLDPAGYVERLVGLGCRVDAWETTYVHVLSGPDPVMEWVKGTGLRPVVTALGTDDADEFLHAYAARLRSAYPPQADGTTLFPFRRIFVVAQRL